MGEGLSVPGAPGVGGEGLSVPGQVTAGIASIAPDATNSYTALEDFRPSPSTCFSDTAGTVSSNIGDRVLCARNQNGSVFAAQSTSANAPILGYDSALGLHYLTGDGLSTWMSRAQKTDVRTILASYILDKNGSGTNAATPKGGRNYQILCAMNTSSATAWNFYLSRTPSAAPSNDATIFASVRLDSTTSFCATSPVFGAMDVLLMRTDDTNYELQRYGNLCASSSVAATGTKSAPVASNASFMSGIGSNGATSSWVKGRVYGFHTWTGRLSDADTAGVQQWARQRYQQTFSGNMLGLFFYGDGTTDEASASRTPAFTLSNDSAALKYKPTSGLVSGFQSSPSSGRDYTIGAVSGGADLFISSTGGPSTTLQLRKCSMTDRFNINNIAAISTAAASGANPGGPCWVKNQDGSLWLDANGLPALIFGVGSTSVATPLYVVQPMGADWVTGGAWANPVALTGFSTAFYPIDPFVMVISGKFYMFYADWTNSASNFIACAVSTSLTGPYTRLNSAADPFGQGTKLEGPFLLWTGGNNYRLFTDNNGAGYGYADGTFDGTTWTFGSRTAVTADATYEHGEIIPITAAMAAAGWGTA